MIKEPIGNLARVLSKKNEEDRGNGRKKRRKGYQMLGEGELEV